ncbi:MAG: glycosyltransferase [Candidatus Sungbacteria bacterium]|nr:glycosyltransferase [Candidatus Sungbacteria bacterium]
MKLIYIAASRIPTEKAHGIQIMQMCAALTRCGAEVELWIPSRKNYICDDPFEYYGIETRFPIRRFPIWEAWWLPFGLGYLLLQYSFSRSLKKELSELPKSVVIYTRDIQPGAVARRLGKTVVWEAHTVNQEAKTLISQWAVFTGIVSISQGLKNELVRLSKLPEERILVARDGFDDQLFRNLPRETRHNYVALYGGSAQLWKGVDTLVEAAKDIRGQITLALSGSRDDIQRIKRKKEERNAINIEIKSVSHAEMPKLLSTSDTAIIPNLGGIPISERYTSPLKAFEAAAAGVPIIVSDLPSLREIFTDDEVTFFPAGDSAALAKAVAYVKEHYEEAKEKARRAQDKIQEYTWDRRASNILRWIGERKGLDS